MEALSELPSDYESCGDCGYDHSYEYEEAYKVHMKLEVADEDV